MRLWLALRSWSLLSGRPLLTPAARPPPPPPPLGVVCVAVEDADDLRMDEGLRFGAIVGRAEGVYSSVVEQVEDAECAEEEEEKWVEVILRRLPVKLPAVLEEREEVVAVAVSWAWAWAW